MTNDDIAGRIAHDLKAPLSPIRTSAYALRQGHALPADTHRELVDVIERQTQRLARMIEEARDWQRAVHATLLGRTAPHDLATLLDLAGSGLEEASPDVRWLAGDGVAVVGDGHRLQQLLAALLGYCARRDPDGAPTVEVSRADGAVEVAIGDRGATVDPAGLLAGPHYQPHDDGLGLGLVLARAIAQAHGGDIEARAREGGGLWFVCVLPLAAGTPA